MSLKHALLGFINYGPMTGYELKKFFNTSVAHFWNAELSQIYPALKAMESDGLVEITIEAGLKIHQAEVDWAHEAIRRIEAMDESAFECRDDYPDIEMRTVTEVLDRIKSVMPDALASADTYHRTHAVIDGARKTREGVVR